jgi:hypothetical protein
MVSPGLYDRLENGEIVEYEAAPFSFFEALRNMDSGSHGTRRGVYSTIPSCRGQGDEDGVRERVVWGLETGSSCVYGRMSWMVNCIATSDELLPPMCARMRRAGRAQRDAFSLVWKEQRETGAATR